MSVRVISGREGSWKAGGGQERVEQGRVGYGQERQLQRATPNAAIVPKHVTVNQQTAISCRVTLPSASFCPVLLRFEDSPHQGCLISLKVWALQVANAISQPNPAGGTPQWDTKCSTAPSSHTALEMSQRISFLNALGPKAVDEWWMRSFAVLCINRSTAS